MVTMSEQSQRQRSGLQGQNEEAGATSLPPCSCAAGVFGQPAHGVPRRAPATAGEARRRPLAACGAARRRPSPGKGLSLKVPELSIGQGTGTEVRIPGFGKVGVLPKLDFGLELLYGATEVERLAAGQDRAWRRADSRHHQASFLIAGDVMCEAC